MGLDPILNDEADEYKRNNWNYSNPDRDDFSVQLVGTVVSIQEVQAMKWGESGPTDEYDYWPTGNPKMNIRMCFATADGHLKTWTFRPASKAAKEGKVPSVHMELWHLTNDTKMTNLIGHTLRITTKQPPEGFGYTRQNPRPWKVEMADNLGTYKLNEPLSEDYKIAYLDKQAVDELKKARLEAASAGTQADAQYAEEIPF